MKIKRFALCGLIFLIIQSLNLSVIDTPQAFTCSEGGFSIGMPGKPILEQVNHKSFVGNVKEYSYTFETETEKYGSSYTELPGVAFSFLSHNSILNKARKGFLKSTGAQQISFQKILFEGKGGRELVFQPASENNSPTTVGKARFYLIGKRMYVVMMTAINSPEGEALIDRYLNSFKILSAMEKDLSLNPFQKK